MVTTALKIIDEVNQETRIYFIAYLMLRHESCIAR
jgi:hypothetical protein